MLNGMARNWWTLLLRGILAVLFGLGILFVWPGYVLATLILVFAIYGIADGVFSIFLGIRNHDYPRWWLVVLEGVVSIIAGVFVLVYPELALATLLYIIAVWAIFTGIVEIVRGIQLREENNNAWLMVFGGVLSVLFGGMLIIGDPETNVRTLLWLFGGLMVGFGVVMIVLSLRIRGKGGGGGTPPRMAVA